MHYRDLSKISENDRKNKYKNSLFTFLAPQKAITRNMGHFAPARL